MISFLRFQPSNSGRSAELLANHGVSLQGFIGFHNQSTDKAVVPVTGAGFEDDTDTAGLDGDIRMVMRKMGKRDATTKLKASKIMLFCFFFKYNINPFTTGSV